MSHEVSLSYSCSFKTTELLFMIQMHRSIVVLSALSLSSLKLIMEAEAEAESIRVSHRSLQQCPNSAAFTPE